MAKDVRVRPTSPPAATTPAEEEDASERAASADGGGARAQRLRSPAIARAEEQRKVIVFGFSCFGCAFGIARGWVSEKKISEEKKKKKEEKCEQRSMSTAGFYTPRKKTKKGGPTALGTFCGSRLGTPVASLESLSASTHEESSLLLIKN